MNHIFQQFARAVLTIALVLAALPVRAAEPISATTQGGPGLCVHIGASEKTADLAANSRWLVHGLAADEVALAKARQAIAARGLTGQAMVEKWTGATLPYPDNFANLLEAPANSSIAREELLRVLAPGGRLEIEGQAPFTKPWPSDIDEWTHPVHGADGNRVSREKFPTGAIGMRWQDGLPITGFGWAANRGYVVAGGRVFTLGKATIENLNIEIDKTTEFITARDAFNGLPLWKVNLGTDNPGDGGLFSHNYGPIATDGRHVFAYQTNRLVAFEPATGKVLKEYPVSYRTFRLAQADGVVVAVGFPKRIEPKGIKGALVSGFVNASEEGAVEAFAVSGQPKWAAKFPAHDLLICDGRVYVLGQKGIPATEHIVVAFDLQKGTELWRVTAPDRGRLVTAGAGVVTVRRGGLKVKTEILDGATGKTLWETKGTGEPSQFVDGLLWANGKKFDPRTGEDKGPSESFTDACTPAPILGGKPLGGRGPWANGNRAACIMGFVPAYGAILSGQIDCKCSPAQLPGFYSMGPMTDKGDFMAARPVETVGSGDDRFVVGPLDWPTYRHDAERSMATPSLVPAQLTVLWTNLVAAAPPEMLVTAWQSPLRSPASAPVVAAGRVFVTDSDRGTIASLDEKTGKTVWRSTVGSRVVGPPTIHAGLVVFGCQDGWVYALRPGDGQLAWRTRIAPADRKMMACGSVESVWPALGPVMVLGNRVYAAAGRSTIAEGGMAILGLNPKTGKAEQTFHVVHTPNGFALSVTTETGTVKKMVEDKGGPRRADLLRVEDGKLILQNFVLNPETQVAEVLPKRDWMGYDGWMDGTWTRYGTRWSGRLLLRDAIMDLPAWTGTTTYGYALRTKGRPLFAASGTNQLWTVGVRRDNPYFPHALVAAKDGVVVGGAMKNEGYLRVLGLSDGATKQELLLPAPVIYDGLAVANGRVYATLQDGTVACLGAPANK